MIKPTKPNDHETSDEEENYSDHAEYHVVYSSGNYLLMPFQYLASLLVGYQNKKKDE